MLAISIVAALLVLIAIQQWTIIRLSRDHSSSTAKWLEFIAKKDKDLIAVTEAYLRSEGKQVAFRRGPTEPSSGWYDVKPNLKVKVSE